MNEMNVHPKALEWPEIKNWVDTNGSHHLFPSQFICVDNFMVPVYWS